MIPSALVAQLERGMRDFLKASFWSNHREFSEMLDRFIDGVPNQKSPLFRGPYVSMKLPFQTGSAGRDYFPDLPMEFPPYGHQQAAFERLGGDKTKNTLVATGTGSGKTECFLFPILDYCLRFHHRPGIKAILIYPMNALAQDQARRFAEEIWNKDNLKSKVRAGLYVGSKERVPHTEMGPDFVLTDKEKIQKYKPDILLTNYKMLDYLLTRPRDQQLWEDNGPETLKYMVVDELHTFDGAQGTDLACLLRRLKARLKTPERHLCCVGTSATLGGDEGSESLVEYAEKIFGEPFGPNSVVGESRQRRGEFFDTYIDFVDIPQEVDAMDPESFHDADAYVRRQLDLWFGHLPHRGGLSEEGALNRLTLGATLKKHAFFRNLVGALEGTPQAVDELIERFRHHTFLATSEEPAGRRYTRLVLTSLLTLASEAKRPARSGVPADEWSAYDGPTAPLVQTQIQLWQREMRRMVATVSEHPTLRHHDDLTREQRQRHLPVVYCRECGTMGWVTKIEADSKQRLQVQLKALYAAYFADDDRIRYFFPASSGLEGRRYFVDPDGLTRHREPPEQHRPDSPALEKPKPLEVVFTENLHKTKRGLRSHKDCPGCNAKDSLSLIGFQAATLSSTYINQLFASKFNDDKKLLTFSDSVQDAAHRAGFFGARTWRFNLRVATQQVVDEYGDLPLAELPHAAARHWREKMGLPRWVATFIAPNMTWLDEWQRLKDSGKIEADDDLVPLIERRLSWEIFGDYSLRSQIGRSLPRMGASAAYIPTEKVDAALAACLTVLQNEIGALRECPAEPLRPAIYGVLQRMIERGAIFQPELDESYLESGGDNTFVMSQKRKHLPDFSPQSRLPSFLATNRTKRFEPLSNRSRGARRPDPTWHETWLARNLEASTLLGEGMAQYAWELIFDALVEHGVLEKRIYGGTTVWGLAPGALRVSSETRELRCSETGTPMIVAAPVASVWEGAPSTAPGASTGSYESTGRSEPTYFARLYSEGDVERIIADEHTGLLERDERTELEEHFKSDEPRPWYPNLLSCTPTLEMGIDVGDLSTALLCSVPPSQANYLQRIGRAGRRDGNALLITLANIRNHDQYFFEEPREMIAGQVNQPGIFLRASAVLERQLTAFCMDCWAADADTDPQALPSTLGDVLENLEPKDPTKFPHNLIEYIKPRQTELFERFVDLFEPYVTDDVVDHLRRFLYGHDAEQGSLAWRILDGLGDQKRLQKSNRTEMGRLKRRIDEWEARKVLGEDDKKSLEEAKQERNALIQLNAKLSSRHTLQFFTDEGLLPNYAFPEAGVTLKSIIWRRTKSDDGKKRGFDSVSYEYERPARSAIRELAPHNTFYAGGRQVTIDRVDLSPDTIEEWQFCDRCNYAEKVTGRSEHKDCPACQSPQFGDIQAQKRSMVRMRRVYASTPERKSLITDDREQRRPRFYQKQMLVSVEEHNISGSMAIEDPAMPFGYDFVKGAKFMEINFGEFSDQGEKFSIANEEAMRNGFQVCRDCGRVKGNSDDEIHHTYGCRSRNKTHDERIEDCLFLYRAFHSEAVRVLLPFVNRPGYKTKLQSLMAALNLGLEEYFGGQIGHLETAVYSEPGDEDSPRKTFLVLYDTVPGGTGYIKDLLGEAKDGDGPAIFAVLERALTRLTACKCRRDSDEKDGCYACLFAYRNSFDMEETSRKVAVELLSEILKFRDELTPVDSLGAVQMSGLFDSALEARLVEAIRREESVTVIPEVMEGKSGFRYRRDSDEDSDPVAWELVPQIRVKKSARVLAAMEIDLLARFGRVDAEGRQFAIFTDGYKDHQSRIGYDFFQRMALVRGGHRYSWSLSWHDVESCFTSMDRFFFNLLGATDQGFERSAMVQMAKTFGVYDWVRSNADENSMIWLNDLLQRRPEAAERIMKRFALATIAGGMLLPQGASSDETFAGWKEQLSRRIGSQITQVLIPEDAPQPLVHRLVLTEEGATMEIYALWTQRGIQETSPREMRVVVWLDDEPELRGQPGFRRLWNGALRLFNLLQFLPRTYFVTSTDDERVDLGALVAQDLQSSDDPAESTQGLMPMDWRDVREEMLEEDRHLVDKLFDARAPLPTPIFALLDDHGHTRGAEAELAWPDLEFALVYVEPGNIADEQAMQAFEDQGWTTWAFQRALEDPEELIEYLDELS